MVIDKIKKYFISKKDNTVFYCVFCDKKTIFNDCGDPPRLNVKCSQCGSLERHRFLFFIYNILFLGNKSKVNVLHLAPEVCIHNYLRKHSNVNYVSADFSPENYKFTDCKREDFTQMTFESKFFDIVLANQVLEHIKKEVDCLNEIRRCLKDDGLLIINIPFKVGLKETFEDENIKSEDDRKLFYGQSDHVRLYGEDASLRFEKAGFVVNQINEDVFNGNFLDFNRLKYINSNDINPGGYYLLRKKL